MHYNASHKFLCCSELEYDYKHKQEKKRVRTSRRAETITKQMLYQQQQWNLMDKKLQFIRL